ncbi:LysR family transcriptional regulator [Mesorhizobium humile]|uniref:LysR family transcriptional regulator n=1 Tax=Mesorhizobium humile TaxID=3072313 RepID=A0ABU4YDS0_9HYPH|nr:MULTISPECIES: LysR family transcriptional regulator [unclassified Mesorhizobium]MDX8460811.1 LysR family transcriptional regulator [Mesorhizobium sp. VK2D]MDX8485100.1 LysR family transcriptional regulator [Mesorhizobium sp. VK2B]
MDDLKLHDLRCFDAVATGGSFQAAAQTLHRTHPSIFAAVARLEEQLGLTLLDRGGYRVNLTEEGRLFHRRAQLALREVEHLKDYAGQLASGEETILRVVIGDVCPRPGILGLLSRFFAGRPRTRLHLDYEAISGPVERLMDGEADLVFHRANPSDPHLERIDLCEVAFMPVVAPGFLPLEIGHDVTPEAMRPFTQCVIRDTARRPSSENFFVLDGAHSCSVPDHAMKKELILHGLAWGHLPGWLIEDELRDGRLLSIAGRHIPGRTETVAAVRRRDKPHGPAAKALWQHLQA